MMRFIRMALLMQKRLLKKPSFIVILLLIPIAVGSITAISKKEAGILRISVYPGGDNDPATRSVVERICEHKDILNVEFSNSASSAKDAVAHGESDCAWIFPENLKKVISDFVKDDSSDEKLVEIYLQEENVPTKLSGELLFGAVFPEVAKEIYLDYLKNDLGLQKTVTDKELLKIYNKIDTDTDIIRFVDTEGKKTEKTNYLVSPIRGILSIFIMISSLASAMYFMKDSISGAFAIMPRKRRLLLLYASVFFGAFDCGVVSFISLCFTPLFTSVSTEIAAILLFITTISAFSAFFSVLLKKPERTGAFLVFISIFVFAFCPVFFDLKVPIISQLLPQTHYLRLSGSSGLLFEALLFFGYLISSVLLFYSTERLRKK
ncbi:MAG: ABC transporter permease [Clostridia bacterium]|nr:ABC transporter permease [Clostridia bacterium]